MARSALVSGTSTPVLSADGAVLHCAMAKPISASCRAAERPTWTYNPAMRTITAYLICAVALGVTSRAAQDKPVDISGIWAFQIDLGGGTTGTPTVTFKQDGEKLTGTYSSQVIGEHQFTGTIKGNEVKFGFDADFGGNAVKVAYSGTVSESGDSMKGTASFGDAGGGTFTATKKK